MIKTMMAMAFLAGAAIAVPADAVTFVTSDGSATSFAATPGTVIDFNTMSLAGGFTLSGSGYSLVTGNVAGVGAQPAYSDGSQYLAITRGGAATLASTTGYSSASVFVGSIDSYNSVQVLSTTGAVLGTFTGAQFTASANGNQSLPSTNRRVTFLAEAGEAIGGLRFLSSGIALEVDNVVFAVPEPSTWMMMLVGFALVGGAMRTRKRDVRFVYA